MRLLMVAWAASAAVICPLPAVAAADILFLETTELLLKRIWAAMGKINAAEKRRGGGRGALENHRAAPISGFNGKTPDC